jgi:hypothetical protein
VSTNLSTWTEVTNFTASSASFVYREALSTAPHRFFRLRAQ